MLDDASDHSDATALNPSGNSVAYQRDNVAKWSDRPFLDAVETASRAEIDALQEQKLLEQLAWVATRSAVVRDVWGAAGVDPLSITSLADFKARAPFMDKDTLRAFRDRTGDPFGGVLCVDRSEVHNIGSSSGTTGDPTIFAERWNRPY